MSCATDTGNPDALGDGSPDRCEQVGSGRREVILCTLRHLGGLGDVLGGMGDIIQQHDDEPIPAPI